MKKLHVWLSLLLFSTSGLCHGEPLQQNATGGGKASPLSSLPEHLKAPAGRICLLADFTNKKDGRVTIYLVNSTAEAFSLASQDGDLGCKRETKTPDGKWWRCDSHAYSWCGNSYMSFDLPAGHVVAWSQTCDTKEGETRPLRFKLYNQEGEEIVSNEGTGIVSDKDVQFCRYDSLAMRHGPFEDVAAVATGRVAGGQGASINGMEDAIRAFERFPREKRLFSVVQEVVARLVKDHGTDMRRGGYIYSSCLTPLQNAVGHSLSHEELWTYVSSHLDDPHFPWRSEALAWLCRVFEWDQKKLVPVLERVLSTPGHPAMWIAAHSFIKVAEKSDAGKRLALIETDKSRPIKDRNAARNARETLFANPYLSIKAEAGEPIGNDGDAAPLKKVTFTNVSPQKITLPVATADSLLVVEIVGASENQEPYFARLDKESDEGSLVIEPGESVSIHDVRWWERVDREQIKLGEYYSVAFLARTPGLWTVPTRPAWSWGLKGEKILKAIDVGHSR